MELIDSWRVLRNLIFQIIQFLIYLHSQWHVRCYAARYIWKVHHNPIQYRMGQSLMLTCWWHCDKLIIIWSLYVGDRNLMLVTWLVTNLSVLSPTHSVPNIRRQHSSSKFVINIDATLKIQNLWAILYRSMCWIWRITQSKNLMEPILKTAVR